jgi:Ser/Thr protein kinase RdoA (MazF antagonist)
MDFAALLPDRILAAVACQGLDPTGVILSLNSYENRVYEIKLEQESPIVAKFYRPGRWDAAAILEEHRFSHWLRKAGLPVVAPIQLPHPCSGDAKTLGTTDGLFYAFFPKFIGREHADFTLPDLEVLGEVLGRMHQAGADFATPHRLHLTPATYGYQSLADILTQNFLPADLKSPLEHTLGHALGLTEPFFSASLPTQVLHGDCHAGNILWDAFGPNFVDFDDMLVGPPVQDVWMILGGGTGSAEERHEAFFNAYEKHYDFDAATLELTEPLRTLRMIRHAAWIGRRYAEPAFKRAFPYYEQRRYWEEFLLAIKEQIALLQEL